jgi:hypothetical protein
MWNFCDDSGRHPYSARRLKMCIFPGDDDLTTQHIADLMGELVKARLIVPYVVNGERYFAVSGWSHQKIDRPQPNKYPAPEDGEIESIPVDSTNTQRTVDEHSSLIGKDRKGEEGKGKDSSRPKTLPVCAEDVPLPDGWELTPQLLSALGDWLAHKRLRGERYKDAESVGKMLTTFANKHGPEAPRVFIDAVPFSIGNNYAGCFSDKDKKSQNGKPTRGVAQL